MEDLSTKPYAFQQRVEDCRTLYLAYQGRHHEEIEREMRALGHDKFCRRVLYARNDRGRRVPGWPERFRWNLRDEGRGHVRDEGRGNLRDEGRGMRDESEKNLSIAPCSDSSL